MQITLTTTGRKSGEARDVVLYAWPDGEADRLVLVASQAGKPADPAWAFNLRAEPTCVVTHRKKPRTMRASELAEGAERDRLWALVVQAFPDYAVYQRRTDRRIPLFVLQPVDG
jgi:F420H(2)-dependent quinone reductase